MTEHPDPQSRYGAPLSILAALGGYASGKTTLGALLMFLHVVRNLWRPAYGDANPICVAMAPTLGGINKSLIPVYERIVPPELIRKKWGAPHPRWLFHNGCDLLFIPGESRAIEGMTICGLHIDEVDKPCFADHTEWTNLLLRLRDPQAAHLLCIATGLSAIGFVRDTFDLDRLDPQSRFNRKTVLMGLNENPFVSPAARLQVLASVPDGYQRALVDGGWLPTEGALFPMFREDLHVVPDSWADPAGMVHLGLDVGISSAAMVVQPFTPKGQQHRGCLVVDEVIAKHSSVEDLCSQVKATKFGHQLVPGRSIIACDPTIRVDEVNAIRRVFPGVHVLKRERSDRFYREEPGVRLVQAALRNASGQTSLYFCERVRHTRNGVLDALRSLQYHERTGKQRTDDKRDHPADALRYAVQLVLQDAPIAKVV